MKHNYTFLIIVLTMLLVAVVIVYAERTDDFTQHHPNIAFTPLPPKWYVLIVGLDIEDMDAPTSSARTDVLIVASLSPNGNLDLLSIPRDTYVEIPMRGFSKINHAFSYGGGTHGDTGIWLTLLTVGKLLDINIENYAIFDLKSIPRLIDAIGGVTIEGVGELNGPEALKYARWRGDGLGDIGRIKRQQGLLQAVFSKLESCEFSQLILVMRFLFAEVRTDISILQALDAASFIKGLKKHVINFHMVPGKAIIKEGISYWEVDYNELKDLLTELRGGE